MTWKATYSAFLIPPALLQEEICSLKKKSHKHYLYSITCLPKGLFIFSKDPMVALLLQQERL